MAALNTHPGAVAIIPSIYFGATAPDWLEIAWWSKSDARRKSIIPHRTITHWLPLWLMLMVYGYVGISSTVGQVAFGFSIGGLLHLIMDWPNPMGIPILTPFSRHSLKWWKSGDNEFLIIGLLFGIAYLVYKVNHG